MDQKQLAYFVSVAKYRNFSRAAQDFYLTQPAISHQIKMLEKELETELFVRNTKKVALTDSGELFLEDAKIILDAMDQAKQKLSLAKEHPSVLRISHLSAPTHQFLPDVVNQFHIRYPHVKIKLQRASGKQPERNRIHFERAGCGYLFFHAAGSAANCLPGCQKNPVGFLLSGYP